MTAEQERLIQLVGPVRAEVTPPGSKSITNRALICAAMAEGTTRLSGVLESEDTHVMVEALRKLGIAPHWDKTRCELEIQGCGGQWPVNHADLYVANSGTTMRFLTAVLSTGSGRYRLDGVPRMRERPIGDLLNALRQLGADVVSETGNDCPPVVVGGGGWSGGVATIRGDISSQFLSGLLLAAPYARGPMTIRVAGALVSQPYVRMTLRIMETFGAHVRDLSLQQFEMNAPTTYRGCAYKIEPDASAASYFWGAAAVTDGAITVRGLSRDSLQGDVAFCDCLQQMGCRVQWEPDRITVAGSGHLRGITVDMNAISDTVQTLAAVALFAEGSTTITGVAHIRHKETDRLGDLARELRKLGATVDELADGLRITPGPLRAARLETYQDHRMAMSLALVGLRVPGITILDPQCTQKTYPDFFRDLAALSN